MRISPLKLFLLIAAATSTRMAQTGDTAEPSKHWAYQPIASPEPPAVQSAAWVRTPIDRFVLARLEAEGIEPAASAGRQALARRVTLDLAGLVPTPEQVAEFVDDRRPGAYERFVDRVLSSPRFGERWGRHWLDVARYADSDGYEKDKTRPHAWRYRDWVIERLNEDQPFDEFTVDQLAGDLREAPSLEQLVATGFHRNTLHNTEGGTDPEEDRVKKTVDRAGTTGSTWLGLTIACAQCHDHKFDALSQKEFFQLYAFFNSLDEKDISAPRASDYIELESRRAEHSKQVQSARAAVLRLERSGKDEPALMKAREELARIEKALPRLPSIKAQALAQRRRPRDTFVHERGDFQRKGVKVSTETPSVLPRLEPRGDVADRLDLANWLMEDRNPLTARVAANRLWAHLFGNGLVMSNDDFGTRGDLPSHPKLLDWLATEFRRVGFSRKSLLRLILLSSTYRQSSAPRPELFERDPGNRLLARQVRIRLEAETVRDISLQVAGLLSGRIGGPSVRPPLPPGVSALGYANSVKWPESDGEDRYRRGLYIFLQRTVLYPMLRTFDAPETTVTCARRERSNTPLQALTMLNDPVFVEAARFLAQREMDSSRNSDVERLEALFAVALSRRPDSRETRLLSRALVGFRQVLEQAPEDAERLASGKNGHDAVESAAWFSLARVLINLDEFIMRE